MTGTPHHRRGRSRFFAALVALAACGDGPTQPPPPAQSGAPSETGADGAEVDVAGTKPAADQDAGSKPTPSQDAGTRGLREPPNFRPEDLEVHVAALADDAMNGRDEGTPGGLAARQLIIDTLIGCGIPPAAGARYEQVITTGLGSNVLARISGHDPSVNDRVVLVGAHYDHLGACGGAICNGANDNAAAVALVLEVACRLAEAPPAKSVLLAFWDAEEPPTFLTDAMGSEFYAAHPLVPLEDTDVAIALDLVGGNLWPGHPSHFVLGREASRVVRDAVDAVVAPRGLQVLRGGLHLIEETPLGRQPWSDYHPFRERGVPTLFLSNGQNKRYHEVSDEVAALDLPKMALEARYLFSILVALAAPSPRPVTDEPGRIDVDEDLETVRSILEDALSSGGLIDALGLTTDSRAALEGDLTRLGAVRARRARGIPADASDVASLRRAAQRVMCLAGSDYREPLCRRL